MGRDARGDGWREQPRRRRRQAKKAGAVVAGERGGGGRERRQRRAKQAGAAGEAGKGGRGERRRPRVPTVVLRVRLVVLCGCAAGRVVEAAARRGGLVHVAEQRGRRAEEGAATAEVAEGGAWRRWASSAGLHRQPSRHRPRRRPSHPHPRRAPRTAGSPCQLHPLRVPVRILALSVSDPDVPLSPAVDESYTLSVDKSYTLSPPCSSARPPSCSFALPAAVLVRSLAGRARLLPLGCRADPPPRSLAARPSLLRPLRRQRLRGRFLPLPAATALPESMELGDDALSELQAAELASLLLLLQVQLLLSWVSSCSCSICVTS
uniref:Uncharacterized protein n=1 Tax=Oryza glaberrima TaxID=4538 RepID=I1Q1U1_ORYGL